MGKMGAYWKNILREIKNTMGRFLSLLIIAALGTIAVVGIQAASIDMRAIADKTYKEQNLYDIQLKSATGFESDDITVLENMADVHAVMPAYIYDAYIYLESETLTVRTYSLPDKLNGITVLDGHLPQHTGECVVERDLLIHGNYKIGDIVTLGLDDMDDYYDVFDNSEFTVVGVVSSPFYLTFERGNTALGDGRLNYYMYLYPEEYKFDVYTDVYVLMEGSQDMDNLTYEYYDYLEEWKKQIQPIGDIRVQAKKNEYADAQKEIDDGWIEYHDGVKESADKIAEARQELNDAKIKLEDAKNKLEEAQNILDKNIADGHAEIDKQISEMTQYIEMATSPDFPRIASEAGLSEEEIAAALLADFDEQINNARNNLDEERIKAQTEIDNGWTEYYEGLDEYNDGVETLEREEADALIKLEEAKEELEEAQEKLDGAPTPEWFYFTRKDGVSYDSYYQDTLRLQKIGYVFPFMFYLVAVLVSLTTMSRMVEEHRTQIGVYKALGYGSFKIMTEYLIYAFSAGVIGGILGVFVGSNLFPRIISDAYGHIYDMTAIETPVPVLISLIAVAVSVGIVMIVTLITCINSTSDTPASLMRPKSPLEGKRVLLERIAFIWNRLSFLNKVTARNIFRYKKRFIMTLIGVAGCSALLLTGFGLRDSVGNVGTLQYEKVINYTSRAYIKEITAGERDEQRGKFDALLGNYLYIREESVTAKTKNSSFSASLIIPETTEKLADFINLRSRKTGENIPLMPGGVLLTEKLARETGVSAGGSFEMTAGDGRVYSMRVSGIVENYIQHYVYMPPDVYTELFGAKPLFNSIIAIIENGADNRKAAEILLTDENVRAVVNTDDIKKNINESTDALGIVTVVLIVLACALAFVVLFNLTNINITERVRELATIKVLGFYNSELAMYIYKENGVVTAMGIILGLIGGIWLLDFVLTSAELDILMFPHTITPASYIFSIVLSIMFTVFVNLAMNYKLFKIDMVESLKNVE